MRRWAISVMQHYQLDQWIEHSWTRSKDGRRYSILLQQDLFGAWILTKRWGSHKRLTGSKDYCCESYELGLEMLARAEKRRQQRGYVQTA